MLDGWEWFRSGSAAPDPLGSEGVFSFRSQVTVRAAANKKAHPFRDGLFQLGRLAVTYFRAGNPHYHRRRVVSPSCSGWEGVGPTRYGRQANGCGWPSSDVQPAFGCRQTATSLEEVGSGFRSWQHRPLGSLRLLQGYRIKPHGQLVSVSLTHYCASTPDLSTRWSSATL